MVELDHYSVPAIEVGDNVQVGPGTVIPVSNVSYDPASATYNAALQLIQYLEFNLNLHQQLT